MKKRVKTRKVLKKLKTVIYYCESFDIGGFIVIFREIIGFTPLTKVSQNGIIALAPVEGTVPWRRMKMIPVFEAGVRN